jgi:hypothetical protein
MPINKTKLTQMIEEGAYVNSKMEELSETMSPTFELLKDHSDESEEFGMRAMKIKGVTYGIRATEAYGNMWKITSDSGRVPEELSGKYTTPERAKIAIEAYVNKQELIINAQAGRVQPAA